MASSVLSLPRLPRAPPASAPAASPRCPAPQPAACSSRLPVRCAGADGAASSIGPARNAGLEAQAGASRSAGGCCSGEDRDACTASGDGMQGGAMRSRREVVSATLGAAVLGMVGGRGEAMARDRRNKREISPADYLTSGTGIKYFDVEEGKGAVAQKGETVMVHFDCVYRSITAVSSRESKILAGNRTIAEPYELTVGAEPGRERKRDFVDNANGLFSAQAAPKPPPALYAITEGMRVGGRRTVIVPPDLGYGQKGLNEIPPGATFDLNIELLEVKNP